MGGRLEPAIAQGVIMSAADQAPAQPATHRQNPLRLRRDTLVQCRRKMRWRQADLAEALGVTSAYVHQIENGFRDGSIGFWLDVSDVLRTVMRDHELTLEDLIRGKRGH